MRYVYLERKDMNASMSSWLTTAMMMLNAAFAEGLTGYIHWPTGQSPRAYRDRDAFDRCPNMFEWYFAQPWCERGQPTAAPRWAFEDVRELVARHEFTYEPFFRQHLVFNGEARTRFAALLARYGLQPERAIGVAWRGTDSVVDGRPRIPIEACFPVLDGLLEAEPDLAIVAKPEERGAADALRRRYPQVIVPGEFFLAETGETRMQDWVNPATGYERGMEVALLILLYSKCRYLLKNHANLSDIATRLSVGDVVSWSTPTTWRRWRQPAWDQPVRGQGA